jgi:hypothetical protein
MSHVAALQEIGSATPMPTSARCASTASPPVPTDIVYVAGTRGNGSRVNNVDGLTAEIYYATKSNHRKPGTYRGGRCR